MTDQPNSADDFTVVFPVPSDAPDCTLYHHSTLVSRHDYLDAEGRLLMHIARFENRDGSGTTRKKFFSCIYACHPDGRHEWIRRAPPAPRPLYRLADRPDATVLLVEGEKCADAATNAFPDAVCMTWSGGSNGVDKADFGPLAGRDVIILPDHDEPGRKAAKSVAERLWALGAARVREIDIEAVAIAASETAKTGYDIADAIADGLSISSLADLLEAFLIVDTVDSPGTTITPAETPVAPPSDPVRAQLLEIYDHVVDLPQEFHLSDDGVIKAICGIRGGERHVFVASPLAVVGRTRGAEGWGHLVAYRTPMGLWEKVVIPARLLVGDGREMREILADRGVTCGVCRDGRQALTEYIGYTLPDRVIEVAARTGWCGEAFVLADRIISPSHCTSTVIAPDMRGVKHCIRSAGDYMAWQAMAGEVGGSSRGVFALSAAFTGPLLRHSGEAGGGFHLFGKSSRGKTTALIAAASVWGGGERDGAVLSWSMTANGGEAIASLHNDLLLPLDEIALISDEAIVEGLYRLANGQGKARASRTGGATTTVNWHAMILSAGEVPVSARLRAGTRVRRGAVTGGLAVRMVDIPFAVADDCAVESTGTHESERLYTEWVKAQALQHYGHAGPAFVAQVVEDLPGTMCTVAGIIEHFVTAVTDPEDDPQVLRVARRFGLVAAAGTLAARWGIVPWPERTAERAAKACYQAWAAVRGTSRSTEELEAIRSVVGFFETHGASRFERMTRKPDVGDDGEVNSSDLHFPVRDRCGYREGDGDVTYYVTPEAWRNVICDGVDADFVARLLRDCGALVTGEGGRLQKKVRLPEHASGKRVYVIRPS